MSRYCQFCGKERPHSHYGGYGPCNCSGQKALDAQNEAEREVRTEAEAKARAEQQKREEACDHVFFSHTYRTSKCCKCGKIVGG